MISWEKVTRHSTRGTLKLPPILACMLIGRVLRKEQREVIQIIKKWKQPFSIRWEHHRELVKRLIYLEIREYLSQRVTEEDEQDELVDTVLNNEIDIFDNDSYFTCTNNDTNHNQFNELNNDEDNLSTTPFRPILPTDSEVFLILVAT